MPRDTVTQRMGALISQLEPLLLELERLSEPRQPSRAYPPASEADIRQAEQRLDWPFPRSYRALLKIHNGWKNYHFTWCLFGVSGPGATEPAKRRKSDLKVFEKASRAVGPSDAELKAEEQDNAEVIYLPHHPPLATNFDGAYLVFDRNRPGENGECGIAEVYRGCEVGRRYRDVCEVIEEAVRAVRQEITSYGGEPDSIRDRAPKSGIQARAKRHLATSPKRTRKTASSHRKKAAPARHPQQQKTSRTAATPQAKAKPTRRQK